MERAIISDAKPPRKLKSLVIDERNGACRRFKV
jgi:hypothetical protein